jgi:hypothetical protein
LLLDILLLDILLLDILLLDISSLDILLLDISDFDKKTWHLLIHLNEGAIAAVTLLIFSSKPTLIRTLVRVTRCVCKNRPKCCPTRTLSKINLQIEPVKSIQKISTIFLFENKKPNSNIRQRCENFPNLVTLALVSAQWSFNSEVVKVCGVK